MILTPIPSERLSEVIRQFRDSLTDDFARRVLDAIAGTSADRAEGAIAERHRQQALTLARDFDMSVAPAPASLSWDGRRLNGDTEAFVLTHEVAHFQLASPTRRHTIDFGLGAGPDTTDRTAADGAAVLASIAGDREEAMVSLLGILWEVALGQPALASFLDQNWLEGVGTPAAAGHFTQVLHRLHDGGFVTDEGAPTRRLSQEPDAGPELRAG